MKPPGDGGVDGCALVASTFVSLKCNLKIIRIVNITLHIVCILSYNAYILYNGIHH